MWRAIRRRKRALLRAGDDMAHAGLARAFSGDAPLLDFGAKLGYSKI